MADHSRSPLAIDWSCLCPCAHNQDDDDLWSPRRCRVIQERCQMAPRSHLNAMLCRRKARPSRRGVEPSGAAGVRALLSSGDAVLCDSDRCVPTARGEPIGAFHRAEYFDFVVRFDLLHAWVRLAPASLLHHKLCDLGFVQFVRDCTPNLLSFEPVDDGPGGGGSTTADPEWVYWYGAALGSESVSQELDLLPEERALASRVRDPSLFETDAACAGFLMALRQRLEQEMVMLRSRIGGRAGGRGSGARPRGLIPRQLVESACHNQVETLVGAAARSGLKAIGTWPPQALPRLRAWAFAQASGPLAERLLRLFDFEAVVDLRTMELTPVCTSRSREEIMAGLAAAGGVSTLIRQGDLAPA